MHSCIMRALWAGAIAIVLNTLALKAADLIPLATARGGLLRLITPWFAGPLRATGGSAVWDALGGPSPSNPMFQTGFHLAVGLAMALLYGLALEPHLTGPSWSKGLQYAAAVWLVNAFAVLPATSEGLAGSAHLSLAGMLWFAAAHTLFFVVLAVVFGRSAKGRSAPSS